MMPYLQLSFLPKLFSFWVELHRAKCTWGLVDRSGNIRVQSFTHPRHFSGFFCSHIILDHLTDSPILSDQPCVRGPPFGIHHPTGITLARVLDLHLFPHRIFVKIINVDYFRSIQYVNVKYLA